MIIAAILSAAKQSTTVVTTPEACLENFKANFVTLVILD